MTVKEPATPPYVNLSDMVEMGGSGCSGVNVAYDESSGEKAPAPTTVM